MNFINIRKKISSIPSYIKWNRIGFGFRLYFRNIFRLPIIIKTENGSNFFLGNDPIDDIILKDLNTSLKSVYFPPELEIMFNDIVFDIGGHHGFFALELSSIFPNCQIYSFEPDLNSVKYFKINKFLNPKSKITLLNVALDKNSGLGFLVSSGEGSWGNYVIHKRIEDSNKILKKSLDEVLSNFSIKKIKYVKINAEGAEYTLIPEFFRLEVFPELILLFAHPERGNIIELNINFIKNNYFIIRQNSDKKRPWFLFKRKVI